MLWPFFRGAFLDPILKAQNFVFIKKATYICFIIINVWITIQKFWFTAKIGFQHEPTKKEQI